MASRRSSSRFPWLPLAILVVGAFVFWGLPHIIGPQEVRVDFVEEPAR